MKALVEVSIENERSKVRDTAEIASKLLKEYNCVYRNIHSEKPSVYNVGDYMLIHDTQNKGNKF